MIAACRSGLFRVWVLVVLAGCGPLGGAPRITRTVGGASREGAFVSPYSYEHFIRAELAAARGQLQEAAEEYRLARAGPDEDPLVLARLADVLDRLGRESEGMQLLDQAASISVDDESVWLTRGLIHRRHGRVQQARDALSRASAAAPRSAAGPIALAELLRELDASDEADAVLERYLGRAHGAGAARARLQLALDRADPLAAADAVHALLEASPARADEVRAAAEAAVTGGHPELALRLLAALPPTPEDRRLRLRAMLAARSHEAAEGLLAGWMPTGAAEMVEVAEGYLAIGQSARALELGRVALSDGGPLARLVVGRALRAEGSLSEAAEMLGALGPGSRAWPAAPIELAAVFRDAGRPAAAAEILVQAHRRAPAIELQLTLAEVRLAQGRSGAALRALAGDAAELRAARARTLDRLGRAEEAVEAYRSLPTDDPSVPAGDRVRAQAERALADDGRERALTLLRNRIEAAPEDRLAASRLAALDAGP